MYVRIQYDKDRVLFCSSARKGRKLPLATRVLVVVWIGLLVALLFVLCFPLEAKNQSCSCDLNNQTLVRSKQL
jgi:hypothetical protein